MIKIDKVSVMNLENAVRGARNPMNSWGKSDSFYCHSSKCNTCQYRNTDSYCSEIAEYDFILGKNDLNLLTKLCKAGSDHRKFMRQIFVSMDINAPLYWWKEFDTYKVGTVANSCSTMHKIHTKAFTMDDFSHDKMNERSILVLNNLVMELEVLRVAFNATKDKETWYSIIQLLPSSYNQLRTVTMTYENLINMYHNRKNHKLSEWHVFCDVVKGLPYANELICFKGE